MARESYWLRSAASYEGGTAADTHAVRLGIFAPGETITRIRLTYFMSSYNDTNPILEDDVVICMGIDVSEDADIPRNFFPATSPAEPWMWWEGETQGIQVFAEPTAGGILTEARGPMDRSPRDIKAQRLNTGTDYWSVWLKTQSTILGPQGQHYLGYAASVLVLQAA